MADKIKVALFSGGRGTASLAEALVRHPQIELSILVNAYDDGLSTGRIRRFVRGLLGPSDIRKNVARMISSDDRGSAALSEALEYRLPDPIAAVDAARALRELFSEARSPLDATLRPLLRKVSFETTRWIENDLRVFLEYADAAPEPFDYSDCSFGNLLLAGRFLREGSDFNRAVESFRRDCGCRAAVVNISQGEPYVLVALKEDGTYLANEAEIVSRQDATRIRDIFLLADYLSAPQVNKLLALRDVESRHEWLRRAEVWPEIGQEAAAVLGGADLIVYGPGTQHSSLFPSYLTNGVAEAIAANRSADKIFISNIRTDHEIQGETGNSLADKLVWYLNRKGALSFQPSDLASAYFVHAAKVSTTQADTYVRFDSDSFGRPGLKLEDWEASAGVHLGGRLLDEIVAIVNDHAQTRLKPFPYMVSIVVPTLNEEKTIAKVLHELVLLNLQASGLAKEIVVVDGGSSDGTPELAAKEGSVRLFRMPPGTGRGEALRRGISEAKGNVIAFFPSDAEYDPSDLLLLVKQISAGEYRAVFGSRAIKCTDVGARLKEIYRGDALGAWLSKWGGTAMSLLCLFVYNRFISDPLTGVKVFDAQTLKSLRLTSAGVDLETEIIAKLSMRRDYILELPVTYHPRRRSEGKKTSILDGVTALWTLLKIRLGAAAGGTRRSSDDSDIRSERT